MKLIVVIAITFAAVFWLRACYLRLTAPMREARDVLEAAMREALANSSSFVGQPARVLFDALGTHTSSGSMDFGLVIYSWRANDLCISAYVRNEVCESLEKYECREFS